MSLSKVSLDESCFRVPKEDSSRSYEEYSRGAKETAEEFLFSVSICSSSIIFTDLLGFLRDYPCGTLRSCNSYGGSWISFSESEFEISSSSLITDFWIYSLPSGSNPNYLTKIFMGLKF